MAGTHSVYVVELDKKVLKHKKVRDLNPGYKTYLPPLYVGMTGLTPEQRFIKHKEGLKANVWVKDHGLRLRPEMYKDLNPLRFQEAEHKEEWLAKKLRKKGYPVLGGNPQLAGRKIKQADWTDYDQKRDSGQLTAQQARVVRKIQQKDTPGLVLYHTPGSGKTRTSIEAYKALGMNTDVIVPAALKENYRKELRKWLGKVPSNVNIQSQQRLANPNFKTPLYNNGLQIIDESQRARNEQTQLYRSLQATSPQKRLLLSGTPMFNSPADLAAQVNLAANKEMLPNKPNEFKKQYFKEKMVNPGLLGKLMGVKPGLQYELQNKDKLKSILDKYVDYYPAPQAGYPSVQEQEVKVPMGLRQMEIYNSILGSVPFWTRYKIKHNLPPGRGELGKMKAFMSGPRQVSNTSAGFTTNPMDVENPKIDAAFNYFKSQLDKDPTYKGIVYSNYINSGIKPYEKLLQKNHIPYGEFSGAISPSLRDQSVRDYNAGKLKALLISGAGSEGLDTTNSRLVQLLESHFNTAKENQIAGRAIRFHSHDSLPPEKRNVLVQHYFSEPKPTLLDRFSFNAKPTGIDDYIHNIALKKDKMNNEIVSLLGDT